MLHLQTEPTSFILSFRDANPIFKAEKNPQPEIHLDSDISN
jgi:hypothetical protein